MKMEKTKTFQELVENQEKNYRDITFLFCLIAFVSLWLALFFPLELNRLTIIILLSLFGVNSVIVFFILSYISKTPIEERLYFKVPVEYFMDSAIRYYIRDAANSNVGIQSTTLFIRSDYMQEYYLEIADVENIEETLKILSRLPKDMIAKMILNRMEPGDDTIADILDTSVCVMKYKGIKVDNYFKNKNWKILIKEKVAEKYEEINRYLPKNEK